MPSTTVLQDGRQLFTHVTARRWWSASVKRSRRVCAPHKNTRRLLVDLFIRLLTLTSVLKKMLRYKINKKCCFSSCPRCVVCAILKSLIFKLFTIQLPTVMFKLSAVTYSCQVRSLNWFVPRENTYYTGVEVELLSQVELIDPPLLGDSIFLRLTKGARETALF